MNKTTESLTTVKMARNDKYKVVATGAVDADSQVTENTTPSESIIVSRDDCDISPTDARPQSAQSSSALPVAGGTVNSAPKGLSCFTKSKKNSKSKH
ncbi:hypothetical protein CVT24_007961 [Panaeolus cyanescens]|uniref:Uncharacterized protein n=1 Tax=Panaeolus cyanescens TaxID=181874 RepID=A0A409YQZ3_9AGAR|nr:hypothetical protein CVT24_007961 [Panaeolus cyanescens]